MNTTLLEPGELDAVVRLLVAEQVRPERNIPFLGDDETGIRAELDALEPPWLQTARVVRAADGSIAGVSGIEWDPSIGRAWVQGPWVFGADDAWEAQAPRLLDAALDQVPDGTDVEMSGEVANLRLAALAAQYGWKKSDVSHVLTIDAAGVSNFPADAGLSHDGSRLRTGTADDLETIRPLHDAEFPNTHTPAERMLSDLVTIVATTDRRMVIGYAAGKIQPDGEGCIDYVAVARTARAKGVGRALVTALTVELLEAATKRQVALVVDDDRVVARGLYESLGFTRVMSMVGYRRVR